MAKTKARPQPTQPPETRPPGRPPGSPNRDYGTDTVKVIPPHCPRCQSTDVDTLQRFKTDHFGGRTPEGFVYTRIVRRRMHCLACNQYFVARFYENPPQE